MAVSSHTEKEGSPLAYEQDDGPESKARCRNRKGGRSEASGIRDQESGIRTWECEVGHERATGDADVPGNPPYSSLRIDKRATRTCASVLVREKGHENDLRALVYREALRGSR